MTALIQAHVTRKRITWILVMSFFLYIAIEKITVVFTDSVNATILWHSKAALKQWDFANYQLTERKLPEELKKYAKNGFITVTKRVGCIEGQRLENRDLHFICDGIFIAKAKTVSIKGTTLTPFEFNGVVPKNKVFLIGDHPDSFDSRYWGFAEKSDLVRGIRLI